MSKMCDNVNQNELMRFWVSELTSFTPQQVESVVEALQQRQSNAQLSRLAS